MVVQPWDADVPDNEEKTPSLKECLQKEFGLAEADFGYQATDLYVVYRESIMNWLKKNYRFHHNVTTFYSQAGSGWNGAGKLCIDIPFEGNWPA